MSHPAWHGIFFVLFTVFASNLHESARSAEKVVVNEGLNALRVHASAPIPSEVTNETQARALSRDAAIAMGQNALLTYVLQKKARSRRKLEVAETLSTQLREDIRATVQGARVVKTQWIEKECRVSLELSKRRIKEFLKEN